MTDTLAAPDPATDPIARLAAAEAAARARLASLAQSYGDTSGSPLEAVAADGVKSFDKGLVQAIAHARSLGDVFHDVATTMLADLAKLAVNRVFGAFPSAPTKGGAASAGSGLFGALAGVLGFAGGGPIEGPGDGKSDSILARVSKGEFVMPAAAAAKNLPLLEALRSGLPAFAEGGEIGGSSLTATASGARANAGRGGVAFDLRGAVLTDDLVRQMNAIGERAQTTAITASVAHTEQRLGAVQRAGVRAARQDLTRY